MASFRPFTWEIFNLVFVKVPVLPLQVSQQVLDLLLVTDQFLG